MHNVLQTGLLKYFLLKTNNCTRVVVDVEKNLFAFKYKHSEMGVNAVVDVVVVGMIISSYLTKGMLWNHLAPECTVLHHVAPYCTIFHHITVIFASLSTAFLFSYVVVGNIFFHHALKEYKVRLLYNCIVDIFAPFQMYQVAPICTVSFVRMCTILHC